jgi:DNA repair exonuclease SbcCD ATPase subunit
MEATTNNGITVEKVLSLQSTIDSLRNESVTKEREIGALEAHVETLQSDIIDLKSKIDEKTPEVRVVTEAKKLNSWGNYEMVNVVSYKNLSSVQDDIRKEVEVKFKEDLENNEKTIKDLNSQIVTIRDNYNQQEQLLVSSYENRKLSLKLDFEAKERDRTSILADKDLKIQKLREEKDLKIQKLNEEIEKIKSDKTDEQVAKQREDEIIKLKLQIKEQKKVIDELTSTNIFVRIWNSICNKSARVQAQVEIIEKEREIEKIKGSSKTGYGMGLMEQIRQSSYLPHYFDIF